MSAEEPKVDNPVEDDEYLANYEEIEEDEATEVKAADEVKKGSYAGIHACGFPDFLLKEELLRAVTDCGFEHPSEVQQECIPQACLGSDIICVAKSGMGKTAVFVLSVLQQIVPEDGEVDTIVLCHTRELAYQICQEFHRLAKYLPTVKVSVFYGGIPVRQHQTMLEDDTPHVVVGTPGRVMDLIDRESLKTDKVKRFVLDECDSLLETTGMRDQVQRIFRSCPHEKQVMMFTATLSKAIKPIAQRFCVNPVEVIPEESKLTLHGLQQFYVKITEGQKNRKLNDLLKKLEFNQVIIFVSSTSRCKSLHKLLVDLNFPSNCMHGSLKQEERLAQYNLFKEYKSRILVATDVFARGVDFEKVNIVFNYDMPKTADTYLHRVGRSGRFGTKGLSITFAASSEDSTTLEEVQSRFEVEIPTLPNEIDTTSYMS